MPKRRQQPDASRRNFLKGAGLVGARAAAVTPPVAANAMPAAPEEKLKAALPGPRQVAAETMPPANDPVNQSTSGGDFMIDVLNSLGIEYMAINCASSFRGLHEAIVNYANNKPEIITCVHEDIAVHMAQGYAKIEGKPMAMACHGVVGLQHATMAMYNAWCDRVPVLVIGGNIMEADKRAPGAEWVHAGVDIGADRSRVHQVGRPAGLAAAFRRVGGARLQDRDDAADGAGVPVARRRAAGKPDPRCGSPAHSQIRAGHAAARRSRRDRGSRQDAGRGAKPGHRRRSRGAHAGRHGEPRRACRDAAMRRHRQCRPHEFPVAASAQPELPPRHDRPGRRHSRHRDERPVGHAHPFQRPHRAQVAPEPTRPTPRSSRSACAIFI